jgi:hypothetical protein
LGGDSNFHVLLLQYVDFEAPSIVALFIDLVVEALLAEDCLLSLQKLIALHGSPPPDNKVPGRSKRIAARQAIARKSELLILG